MAEEIEFRFPSSQPYAYVNVKGTAEELGKLDLEQLASLYANSLVGFRRYEQAALEYMAADLQRKPEPVEKSSPFVGEDAAADLVKELGATEIDSVNEAPYKAPAPAAKAKPWEAEKPKPVVVTDIDGW